MTIYIITLISPVSGISSFSYTTSIICSSSVYSVFICPFFITLYPSISGASSSYFSSTYPSVVILSANLFPSFSSNIPPSFPV